MPVRLILNPREYFYVWGFGGGFAAPEVSFSGAALRRELSARDGADTDQHHVTIVGRRSLA